MASTHLLRREWLLAQERISEVIHLSKTYDLPYWLAIGNMFEGRIHIELGEINQGFTQLSQGLADFHAIGTAVSQSAYMLWVAEAQSKTGQPELGLQTLKQVLAIAQRTGELFFIAEVYRLQGEFVLQVLASAQPAQAQAEAETSFVNALKTAHHQQAKSLELRAATSLARLWQQQGKCTEARQLLTPVYGWFTEGFDTADLNDTKALLDELS